MQYKLSDLYSFSNGINTAKENYGKGRKMISVMDILSEGYLYYDNILNSVDVPYNIEQKNKVEDNDLIFVRSSETRDEVGWTKSYRSIKYSLFSGFVIRGSSESNNNSFFVESSLNYKNRKQIETVAEGSTRYNIGQKSLQNISLSVPILEEQTQITKLLESLHYIITLEQEKLNHCKRLREFFLQKVMPSRNKIIPEWRFDDFNDKWEIKKLEEVGDIQTGNTPKTSNLKYYDENGLLWATPTDIKDMKIKDTKKKLSNSGSEVARIVPKNSILVTSIASIGKNALATEKIAFNQQINALIPHEENDSYFLYILSKFWSEHMKRIASTGTMQIINKTEFSRILTVIPSYKEQERIGQLFKKIDKTIDNEEAKIEKYINIKNVLLNNLFL